MPNCRSRSRFRVVITSSPPSSAASPHCRGIVTINDMKLEPFDAMKEDEEARPSWRCLPRPRPIAICRRMSNDRQLTCLGCPAARHCRIAQGCGEGLGDLRQFVQEVAPSRRDASSRSPSSPLTRISNTPRTTCAIRSSWSISVVPMKCRKKSPRSATVCAPTSTGSRNRWKTFRWIRCA